MASAPFHLAFPVSDLEATKDFFIDVLVVGQDGRPIDGLISISSDISRRASCRG